MGILFLFQETKNLSFEIYFYQKQNQDENDEPNQNLVISFVEYFVQFGIFSVSSDHYDNKSNKKTGGKY